MIIKLSLKNNRKKITVKIKNVIQSIIKKIIRFSEITNSDICLF